MVLATRCPEDIIVVGLAYNSTLPVGACIITKTNIMLGYNVGVFVAKAFRRRGIGSKLLNYVNSTGNYNLKCCLFDIAAKELYKELI